MVGQFHDQKSIHAARTPRRHATKRTFRDWLASAVLWHAAHISELGALKLPDGA